MTEEAKCSSLVSGRRMGNCTVLLLKLMDSFGHVLIAVFKIIFEIFALLGLPVSLLNS